MKHGKRPTVAQKQIISSAGLNPDNWLVVKNTTFCLEIVHRKTGKRETLGRRHKSENQV